MPLRIYLKDCNAFVELRAEKKFQHTLIRSADAKVNRAYGNTCLPFIMASLYRRSGGRILPPFSGSLTPIHVDVEVIELGLSINTNYKDGRQSGAFRSSD